MARFNKAKNFAGKSYVVSNEVEALINSLTFDATNSTLGFGAGNFGDDTTAAKSVSFASWINDAKTAAANSAVTTVVGTAQDTATANTVYGAKADATAKANKALEDAKAYADTISAAAISVVGGNGISIDEDGVEKTINVKTDLIKLVAGANTNNEFASVYDLQIADATATGGYKTVGSINIPKDQFLTNATYANGKITLTFAVAGKGNVATEIDVADLIDTYTAAQGATQIQLAVDSNNVFSASVVAGSITETDLNASVNASLDKADSALQKADIASGSANGTIAVDGADVTVTGLGSAAFVATTAFDAAGTAQGLIEALDSTQTAATGKYISGITQVDGKITAITETALPAAATLVTGTDNGTVKFNGTDVAVKGLGSAAYENTDAFDAAGAAATAQANAKGYTDAEIAKLDVTDTAVVNEYVSAVSETDGKIAVTRVALPVTSVAVDATSQELKVNGTTIATLTPAGIGADAAGAAAAVLGSDADTAGAATVYGANKAAAAASAAAGVADGKAVAAQNTADGIKTAVSGKAVELIEKTVNLTAGTVDGITVAIEDSVVTMTVPGRVICVYDAQGKQVYPDVTYNKVTSTTTLVADYGTIIIDASWDVTYSKAITIA